MRTLAGVRAWVVLGTVAAIAVASVVGYRWLTKGCVCPNWMSAVGTLRNLAWVQEQYRAAVTVDEDGDGTGEYGGFLEMSCAVRARGRPDEVLAVWSGCPGPRAAGATPPAPTPQPSRVPVLSGAFRTMLPDGTVQRSGYRFRMVLVGRDGAPAVETPGAGFGDGTIDPDLAERRFVCYAWPTMYGTSGDRTFVVDETGAIFGTDDPRYSGAAGPASGAAMSSGGLRSISGTVVPGVPAQDGNVWTPVN